MDELVADQIQDIINNQATNSNVKILLSLFCSNLKGAQLMENKYAMLIYFGDKFLLAHVKAEKGMSLNEGSGRVELIRRFLDVDNILSAAYFELKDNNIVFSHFTDTGSDAFRDFLGVKPQKYHYEKKNIQIVCYYQGNRTLEAKFEFTNDEFDNLWLEEQSIDLTSSHFTPVKEERAHEIKEIRWGSDSYNSIEAFKSDFREYTMGLEQQRTRYDRLHQYPSDSSISAYSADHVTDYRHEIELIRPSDNDSKDTREVVDKGEIPDDLHVIYASKHIEIDSGFADDIFQDIMANSNKDIYHPSGRPAANKLEVGNLSFLNIDESDITSDSKEFVRRTHNHAVNRGGETVSKCLTIAMISIIEREAENSFQNGLNQILNVNTGNPKDKDVISKKENEETGLIEYKNAKSLESDDPATKIVGYIETEKRNNNNMKVFMFGFTEQNRRIEGFDTQSWNDDRVAGIEKDVRSELDGSGIDYEGFMLQSVELGSAGDRWAIIGMVY